MRPLIFLPLLKTNLIIGWTSLKVYQTPEEIICVWLEHLLHVNLTNLYLTFYTVRVQCVQYVQLKWFNKEYKENNVKPDTYCTLYMYIYMYL